MSADLFLHLVLFVAHFAFSVLESLCCVMVDINRQISDIFYSLEHKESADLSLRIKALRRIPTHISVIAGEEKPSYKDLALMVIWSLACGIPFISFYDCDGVLKKTEFELRYEVEKLKQKSDHIIWHSDQKTVSRNGSSGKQIHLKLLSACDGRDTVADLVKTVVEKEEIAKINIDLVDKYLKTSYEFPDPDLVLSCGKTFCICEYPPWQLRLTEIVLIRSHHNVCVNTFVAALEKYNKCEQRLGK